MVRAELNDNMCPAIAKALRKYAEINGNLPARIIMYRLVLNCPIGAIFEFSIPGTVLVTMNPCNGVPPIRSKKRVRPSARSPPRCRASPY